MAKVNIKSTFNKASTKLRDYLIKKHPPTHMLLPAAQEERWLDAVGGVIQGEHIKSVSDALKKLDLGITSNATGVKTYIDLHAGSFPFIFDALNRVTTMTGEIIYILAPDGEWRSMAGARFKAWVQKPFKSGYVEIAVTDARGRLTGRHSVNFWKQNQDVLEAVAPRAPVKKIVASPEPSSRFVSPVCDAAIGPIDVVYTWVNSDDPAWQELISPYREVSSYDGDRFAQVDELRYSIRSLFTFAPWVRKVFIFTNCAPPTWFVASDRVQWIMHDEVIPEHYLPLFSSHSIETFLHKIPGLSERYVYFNDDVFLSAPVAPDDFFTPYGQSVSRMEPNGVVHYLQGLVRNDTAEEWQHAAVNSAELLLQQTEVMPTKLHRHTPHAYVKSAYEDMELAFPREMHITRSARFRQKSDFSFTSFIYHHFARSKGRAVHIDEEGMIVRSTNYKRFLERKVYSKQRFFCINDGGGSASNSQFNKFKKDFLTSHYRFRSPAEK